MIPGTVLPAYQLAYEGDHVLSICFSEIEPSWSKDGKLLQLFSVLGTLTLTNVQEKDSGIYTCHGTMTTHIDTIFTTTYTLLVGGKMSVFPIQEGARIFHCGIINLINFCRNQ